MNKLIVAGSRDGGNQSGFCSSVSNFINALVLVANTAASVTVPIGASLVYITSSDTSVNFWMDVTKTAVIPTATTILGNSLMLNPGGRIVTPGNVLSFISTHSITLILEYYE